MFMRYLFRPHRAIFRQHTYLSLSIVLLKNIVVIINLSAIGCLFSPSYVLRPLCAPWVCRSVGRVYPVLICIPCTHVQWYAAPLVAYNLC
jgi:hypothetical protein